MENRRAAKIPYSDDWSEIDIGYYRRSVRVFNTVKDLLGVKMKLHADTQVQQGSIFLFNHFSRFETFIPQFLIFEQTGAYSCAIASSEFFSEDTVLSRYLRHVGVFPHDHQRLFPLLAAQILRGRKVVIFPEGGMVKDRRVIDNQGRYSIYSRMTGERRKHHTGAAVLAQGLEAFKATVRNAYAAKNDQLLLRWKEDLKFDSLDELLISALKPTLIIPSNITFYPIRSSDNLLLTGVELFNNDLSRRQTEELLVEGNILLKNTDMDVRMGKPIDPYQVWHWWNRYVLGMLTAHLGSLDEIFSLNSAPENWKQKLLGSYFRTAADATRNQYMAEIYANVTINLSHLAATLIMYCVENAYSHIRCQRFFNALYIAVKRLQQQGKINLHRSLLNPHDYNDLLSGTNNRFAQFICVAKNSSLITEENDSYHFLPKLLEESSFDDIRLENLIAVYNNEAEPIKTVRNILIAAFEDAGRIEAEQLLNWYLDDEYRDLSWERHVYSKPRYNDINRHETANAEPLPFFLKPGHTNCEAVLLIHGLLASPAELRAYGEHLEQMGYTVLAVRLKGHGSSPYALRNTTWEDWYASVIRGFEILRQQGDRIFVTGFSTGGALALKLVSEHHPEIIGVCGVSLPVRFINPAFMLVPLLHGTNKLIDFLSVFEGVKPFLENDQEHPFINYRHVPVKALYELRQLIHNMEESVAACQCPVLIMHGDDDPVVSVKSADVVMGKLKTTDKRLTIVPATRHGILMENISGTWASIDQFMTSCQGQ